MVRRSPRLGLSSEEDDEHLDPGGLVLALALLPFGAVFWWGFALPFGPVLAVARTILILISWRSLE